jgi:alpha-L-arabinofuranosidase
MSKIAGHVDFVSVHNGFAPVLSQDAGWDVRTVYSSMLAAPLLIKPTLVDLASQVDAVAPKTPPEFIDVAEWGPLFSTNATTQRFNDHVKTMGSALLIASTMKVYLEDPRTQIANGFQMVEEFTQGWIGPRNGQNIPKAAYDVFQLFTRHFGTTLVSTDETSPTYEARSMGRVDAVGSVPYLEGVSSIDDTGKNLYVVVINKHFDRSITTQINFDGFKATAGTAYAVTSSGVDANTGTQPPAGWPAQAVAVPDGRFYLGGPGEINVASTTLSASGSSYTYQAPPHSVTALVFSGATN